MRKGTKLRIIGIGFLLLMLGCDEFTAEGNVLQGIVCVILGMIMMVLAFIPIPIMWFNVKHVEICKVKDDGILENKIAILSEKDAKMLKSAFKVCGKYYDDEYSFTNYAISYSTLSKRHIIRPSKENFQIFMYDDDFRIVSIGKENAVKVHELIKKYSEDEYMNQK